LASETETDITRCHTLSATQATIFALDILGNFFQHHLPGGQAYNLDVDPDPGVVPWLGSPMGPVNEGWGEMTIPELKAAASDAGVLIVP
jgi:hypothetical protein